MVWLSNGRDRSKIAIRKPERSGFGMYTVYHLKIGSEIKRLDRKLDQVVLNLNPNFCCCQECVGHRNACAEAERELLEIRETKKEHDRQLLKAEDDCKALRRNLVK
jgi:hypothetical protein